MAKERPRLLTRLLAVTPAEAPRVVPAAAFQFSFVAGVALLKSVASALVVARFDATTLAWLYLGAAVAAALAASVDAAVLRTARAPLASMVVSAALTAVLGVGAALGWKWAVAALYLFAEGYATLTSVRFWASLGEGFDPRESKRLFGVIGGFGMGGMILGGLLGGLASVAGALSLLLFAMLSMLGCAALSRVLRRQNGAGPRRRSSSVVEMQAVGGGDGGAPVPSRSLPRLRQLGPLFRGDRYLRLLGVFAALAAVLTVVSDYLFRVSAQGAQEDELAVLFGVSSLALGVCAMAFQLFAAGRVLTRFGVFRYLSLVPFGTFAVGLVCLVRPGLWPAFALRVVESLGSLSLQPTGMQLLYAPLPDSTRVPARAVVDGLIKKGGAALGGLSLIALAEYANRGSLAIAVVGISAVVYGVLAWLRVAYVALIDARLTGGHLGHAVALDAESRAILLQRLGDRDPDRVLLAADLLAAHKATPYDAWVRMLLAHPSDWVRTKGVKLSAELGLREVVPKLRSMAEGDVRRPRDEAIFALARLDLDARAYLSKFLSSSDPGVRASAVAALLPGEHSREEADGPARRALRSMLEAREAAPAERRELARLLGRLAGTPYAALIDPLLDDPDPSVRRLAAASAGECDRTDLAPKLLTMLADRRLRREVRQALASMGDAILGLLEQALNDKSRPARERYELPRLLRYVGTDAAANVLLSSNPGDDPFLRYRIAQSLTRMHRTHEELVFDRARVNDAVQRRVDAYLYYLPIYRDLHRALGGRAILVRALGDRLDQGLETVFRLLGLVWPQRSMLNVYNRLVGGEPRERSYALELFEHLVDEGTRARLLPMLERWHRLESDEGEVERVPARLMELSVSKDAVLRACALHGSKRAGEEGEVSEQVVEKVFLLEGVSIFEKCSVDDLSALAAIAAEKRFAAGEVIFRENDPGDSLYVIVDGKVRTEKEGNPIMEQGPKEAFGETSLLDGLPRPASTRALTDARVLVIDRQDFLDLLADRPEILQGLFAVLTRQMRQVLELAAAKAPAAAKVG